MRKYVWLGCTVTGMTVALLGAPVAQADDAGLLAWARAQGLQHEPVDLIRNARGVCYAFWVGGRLRASDPRRDNNPDDVVNRIARNLILSPDKARQFVVLSVNEYCPEYSDRVGD